MDGSRLASMFLVGFFLLMVGLTGKLGSFLGAIIDPANMQQSSSSSSSDGGSANTGLINPGSLPTSGTLTATQIAQYAILANFPNNALIIATAIALAESGGQIAVTHKNLNGSTDYGLWQINSVHTQFDTKKLLTAAYNAQAAYKISGAGADWTPWTTYNSGAYQRYLNQAQQGVLQAVAMAV